MDDAETYAMLASGEATGVFQFESSGMREALRQVKPTDFNDLIALVALYRPGPMGYIPVYARRKNGQEQVTYSDPRLEPILHETSESACTRRATCASRGRARRLLDHRRGRPPQSDREEDPHAHGLPQGQVPGGLRGDGDDPGVAKQLWDDVEKAADYSFPKAHAACYALIAYRTAWLKAHFPREYMAALISSVMNTKDRVPLLRQRLPRAEDRGRARRT